jgi:pimeloyl-ACP methyl ester carboxylesterase
MTNRSSVPAILGALLAGLVIAIVLVLAQAERASEPSVTGSVLLAFGIGWGLMALLTTRFSSQSQAWTRVPGAALAVIGLGLMALRPGGTVMDVLGWLWPPAIGVLAIWMLAQARASLPGRGRWLVMPVIGALLVLAIGGGLATVSGAIGRGDAPASGELIDVGGRRLYIECAGSGSPVVVLQAGLGESSAYWDGIASTISSSTTVCRYDRAGHGRSDATATPQDGIALASDLHTLLERAGVPGPYVLVGHSSGGPYVRVFADRYPDETAGMVLLDAQPADAFEALPNYPGTYQALRITYGLGPSLARVGLLGIILGLPADQSTVAAARGVLDEVLALPSVLQQAQRLTSLGDRPLVVVSAGTGQQAGWLAAQDLMGHLSTNSVHRVLADATHSSIISGADAPPSSQAILEVVGAARGGTALR